MLFEKIKQGNYDADDPIWEQVSLGAKDAVARLLTVDTHKRLTAAQALAHPWIARGVRTPEAGELAQVVGQDLGSDQQLLPIGLGPAFPTWIPSVLIYDKDSACRSTAPCPAHCTVSSSHAD